MLPHFLALHETLSFDENPLLALSQLSFHYGLDLNLAQDVGNLAFVPGSGHSGKPVEFPGD